MRLVRARLRAPADREDRELLHLQRQDGVEHVDLDELTLARPLAVEQRGERALERHVGGDAVDQELPGGLRRVAGAADRLERAAHRLQEQILPRPVRVRAVLPVPGHRDVDDVGVERAQRLVVHAEPLGDAGPVVLEEDVGRARQLPEDLAPFLRLEVDGEAALVAIEREEARVDAVPRRAAARDVAMPLTGDGLDLDDVRSQIAEPHRGQRARHRDRAVEHAHAREGSAAILRRAVEGGRSERLERERRRRHGST